MQALAYLIGAGSMSLGVEAAGFNLTQIWETPGYGKNAETWNLNRPDNKVRILELDYTNPHFQAYQGLDMIYGNPPCGGLSSMTCSRIGSPTNNCMRQWIRMVVQARPRMILMENAYQLATERVAPLLNDLTGVLDEAGYWYWTWMFYSYQIGTPQIRRRMFLCASLDQPKNNQLLKLDDLPEAKKNPGVCPVAPYLYNLVHVEPSPHPVTANDGSIVTQHWYHWEEKMRIKNALVAPHRARLEQGRWVSTKEFAKQRALAEAGDQEAIAWCTKHESLIWNDVPKEFQGMCMHRPSVVKWDQPAPAIIGSFKYVHPVNDRFLTMREMARLMGYPDHWQFHKLQPHLIAQGIPVASAQWAADRMLKVIGAR